MNDKASLDCCVRIGKRTGTTRPTKISLIRQILNKSKLRKERALDLSFFVRKKKRIEEQKIKEIYISELGQADPG